MLLLTVLSISFLWRFPECCKGWFNDILQSICYLLIVLLLLLNIYLIYSLIQNRKPDSYRPLSAGKKPTGDSAKWEEENNKKKRKEEASDGTQEAENKRPHEPFWVTADEGNFIPQTTSDLIFAEVYK